MTIAPAAMPTRKKRKYGLPYKGFTSAVPAHMCPPDMIWGQGNGGATTSANVLYDPSDGHFYPRAGSAYVGSDTGLLEDIGGITEVWRARKLIGLDSPSIASGFPTHCVLFTDETNHVSALYLRAPTGGVDYQLGEEYSAANHYPGTTAATFNFKVVPYFRTTDATYGRLNTAALRGAALAGSRGMQEAGNWLYFPCLNATPVRWNKRYNESSGSGSENLRLQPTGAIPPTGNPFYPGVGAAGTAWLNGDTFYISVAFQYEDGSVSMPLIPQAPSAANANGIGYVAIGSNGAYWLWTGIPTGPYGVVGRWLLRTPKVNTVTQPNVPVSSPLDLMVTGYIGNNTATTYSDYNGNDLSLSSRPDIIRFDRVWQPPARYLSNFDGRFICGYTKAQSAAIVVGSSLASLQVDDDSATLLGSTKEVDVNDTLANRITFKTGGVTDFQVTISGTKSLSDVVKEINDSGVASSWSAQLAPGADGGAASNLLATTVGCDTGDTSGRIRVFGNAVPAVLHMGTAYLANFPTYKNRWFFTQGGPGVQSNLADAWLAGNYRTGLASWGILQGFAPLLDGCLIFFSKAIVLFRNIKSGKSGLDDDYHPDDLFTNLGCIAWDSIAYGDGWAGCLTDRGYAVFDGTRGGMRIISADVYNPATGGGEWAYEVAQCIAATGGDTDGAHFHAKAMGGVLRVTYRSSLANTETLGIPDRCMEYNFSLSSSGTGLDQVLRSDGTPWGWSPPSTFSAPFSVMGEVRTSSGVARYGVVEPKPSQSFKEKIVQFETGAVDPGPTGIDNYIYGPLDFAEGLKRKQAQLARVVYKGTSSAISFEFARSDGTTTTTHGVGLLPSTGALGTFSIKPVPLPTPARSPAKAHQYSIYTAGSGDDTATSGLALWGLELDLIETTSYR